MSGLALQSVLFLSFLSPVPLMSAHSPSIILTAGVIGLSILLTTTVRDRNTTISFTKTALCKRILADRDCACCHMTREKILVHYTCLIFPTAHAQNPNFSTTSPGSLRNSAMPLASDSSMQAS